MVRHMRYMIKIIWQDKVTKTKVITGAGLTSMEDLLIRKNLLSTGHLLRMSTHRLLRQVTYSPLPQGRGQRGHLRFCTKDTIKRNIKKRKIDTDSWTSMAPQRDVWN